ncbi:hypothetical protein [uncultured Paenibacillus sp.]|uniref:hypothetical protein n=1 Tax=uncultured Paenibacillus sp. TaxID=227322 RepID=UPI0015AFAA21|nr:hypothetical protein [uncultured Paenibacillus sp.]
MVHVSSLLIPAAMLFPNLLFMVWPPKSMPGLKDLKENVLSKVAEGIGRAGVVVLPLFSAVRAEGSLDRFALAVMLLSLGFYVIGWFRYLRGDRQYRLLFAPILGIPVPMAVMPVLYFMSASLLLHSVPLLVCSLVLGIGHIPASLRIQRFLDNHGLT